MTTNYSNYASSRKPVPLAELLPLDTPLSLMVDPSNACNFKCVFCPTGDGELLKNVSRPKGTMTLELFSKLVNDLVEFPRPIRVLHLYKDGEPLVNRALPEMVRIAKASGWVSRVETTTNGSILTADRASELIDAGLDGIRISVYALDDQGYRDVARAGTSFETVRNNVQRLFELKSVRRPAMHVHCKIVDTGLSEEQRNRFLSTFAPIADSVHIDGIMGWSNTEGHNMTLGLLTLRGMSGAPLREERMACSEPFMKLAINFDGSVSVCCVDWAHDTVVGHVQAESLASIWRGDKLRALRRLHLEGRRSELRACATCQYVHGLPPHTDFDHRAQDLLSDY